MRGPDLHRSHPTVAAGFQNFFQTFLFSETFIIIILISFTFTFFFVFAFVESKPGFIPNFLKSSFFLAPVGALYATVHAAQDRDTPTFHFAHHNSVTIVAQDCFCCINSTERNSTVKTQLNNATYRNSYFHTSLDVLHLHHDFHTFTFITYQDFPQVWQPGIINRFQKSFYSFES